MAKFDLPSRNQNTRNNRRDDEDFVPAEFWVNVGYYATVDGEEVFISLTRGIPLDELKPQKGNSEITKLKNQLNSVALAAAQELEPGQAEDVVELTVQIRRVSPAEDMSQPIAGSLTKLTCGSRKPTYHSL